MGGVAPEARVTNGGQDAPDAKELALALLEQMATRADAYDRLNTMIKYVQGTDFPTHVAVMDEKLYAPCLALIDAVLGDDVGTYFFREARLMNALGHGGGSIAHSGREWPIRHMADVRTYLAESAGLPQ